MTGTLIQLNISPGGMPKTHIPRARVTVDGFEGDWQTNRMHHGGLNRAICLFSEELYDLLKQKRIDGLFAGAIGENFTTRGLDLQRLAKGDRLKIGGDDGCTIEITDVRVPCRNLRKWNDDLPEMIVGQSGWVCKVTHEGIAAAGDAIQVEMQTPSPVLGRGRG